MAENGKSNSRTEVLPPEQEEKREPQEADEELPWEERLVLPIEPLPEFPYKTGTAAYTYYRSIQPKLHDWWFEFVTAQDSQGKRKYQDTVQFSLTKARDARERIWIRQMIGRQPVPLDGEKELLYEMPYLGNWKHIRRRLSTILDRKTTHFLQRQFKKQLQQLKKAEAIAIVAVQDVARWTELQQQIDDAFCGEVFLANEPPTSERNRLRMKLYHEWQKWALERKTECAQMYFRSLGLSPKENWTFVDARGLPVQPGQQQLQLGGVQDPMLTETARVIAEGECTLDDLMMAKAIRAKAKLFQMKLPGDLNNYVEDTTPEDLELAKAKKGGVH